MRVMRELIRTRSAGDGSIRAWSGTNTTHQSRDREGADKQNRDRHGADLWPRVPPVLFVCAILFAVLGACHESTPIPPPDEPPTAPEAAAPPPLETPPPRVRLPDDADAADRWLFVEKAKDGSPGGWARLFPSAK